jgi:hypothetical protein
MISVKDPEFDARLLNGIRVALRKARELGYNVERMDVSASVSEGVCSVHFAPLARPGTIVAGGDLSLTVAPDTEEILEVKRGQ